MLLLSIHLERGNPMYRIANAKQENIDSDGKWVIICLASPIEVGEYSHGCISPGFPTKKHALGHVQSHGNDWCEGCNASSALG